MVDFAKEYNKLLRIRTLPEYPLFGRPSSEQHYNQCTKLREMAHAYEDDLLNLILRDEFPIPYQRHELMMLGAHGGSFARKYNVEWWGFMEKLRKHRGELPQETVAFLDLLKEKYGW